jgi:hypothetical protein
MTTREGLRTHRTLIASRSLLAAAAGVVPVPIIDDILASLARAHMLRQIADARQVDVTRDALAVLSDEPQASRTRHAATTGITLVALRKAWRKMFLLLAVTRRGEEFAHSFELGTLFDHYCTRHHVGAAVDGDLAARLRQAFDRVGTQVRKEAALAAGRSLTIRRRPGRELPQNAEPPRSIAPSNESLLAKARRVLDEDVGGLGDAYVRALIAAFDREWEQHKAGAAP